MRVFKTISNFEGKVLEETLNFPVSGLLDNNLFFNWGAKHNLFHNILVIAAKCDYRDGMNHYEYIKFHSKLEVSVLL